jgi:phage replication-related protein YjqB (UPF0714/DUF867 family)
MMPGDWYSGFQELSRSEREGTDFRIRISRQNAPVAIIAPHGGSIEPHTSATAAAIAGTAFSLYCFEGLRDRKHCELHITSTNFDEPQCLELIARCDVVVAVHGLAGRTRAVDVGGLDEPLRDAICQQLVRTGFNARIVTSGAHAARSAHNICNRGHSRAGVQLEITRPLRDELVDKPKLLRAFAAAIRQAITEHLE